MIDIARGKSEGGYVFISHAHKDIHEVRKIRNILEENGLEPICFYLRCLSDDDEILDLIKREIDARDWFLSVDSKNARESNWVKTEKEYIQSKNPQKMVSVSLDHQEEIRPTLDRLSNSMRVFLAYSHKDKDIAHAIYTECLNRDFKVFYDLESIYVGDNMLAVIEHELYEASKYGCVVLILSKDSLQSPFVMQELFFAAEENAYILPIIVDSPILPSPYHYYLADRQEYQLKTPVTAKQVKEIVDIIDRISIGRLMEG